MAPQVKIKKISLTIVALICMVAIAYCKNQPLRLSIRSAKQIYEVGEDINIDFVFKNISNAPIELFIFESDFPLYHEFEFSDMGGDPIASVGPESEFTKRTMKQVNILPGSSFKSTLPLHKWKLAGVGHDYTAIGSEPRKFVVRGAYFFSVGLDIALKEGQKAFFGRLISSPITVEVVEKNEPADYPASALASKAKSLAEDFMSKQYYKNSYEGKASAVTEFAAYVDCYFKRKIPLQVKGDGLVRVHKRTWKAEWIGSE